MPRAMINEIVQLGVEGTPGTPVVTTKRWTSSNIVPDDQFETSDNTISGRKYDSGYNINKEWMEWPVDGAVNYNEMTYHLSSLVKEGVHTALTGDDTGAHEWLFEPNTFSRETIKYFTFANGEPGVVNGGERCSMNHMIGAEITFDRDGVSLSGRYRGRELLYPHTVETAGVSDIPDMRAYPDEIDVFVDASSGALGTTKLLTAYSGVWRLNDRRGIAWTLNSALNSWAHDPEIKPTAEFALVIEDDATSRTWRNYARLQTQLWFRVTFTGPIIVPGGTAPYLLQFSMPCKVKTPAAPSDVQAIRGREFTFGLVHDDTWGKAYSILLRNAVAAL